MDAVEDEESKEELEDIDAGLLINDEVIEDPYTFNEAFFDDKPKRRSSWHDTIKWELDSMEKCKVWTALEKRDMPKGRKTLWKLPELQGKEKWDLQG
jgi:hypothetical protein